MWTLPYNPVLVPVDLEAASMTAARGILGVLAPDARLHVLTVVEVSTSPAVPVLGPSSARAHATHEARWQRERTEEIREYLEGELDDRRVAIHVRLGRAADTIVDFAEEVDAALIALPTHGRTGARRLLLGSVAERVVRLARRPVLILRG